MKSILIVNDDGINSPGIRAAAEAVRPLGKITIVAPAVQQSGVGRSISLFSPVSISKVKIDDFEAYSISGTPVDAVILGIYGILKNKPDLLISGINIGENMSSEASTSGTVGAALEGASQGVPSVAISIHTQKDSDRKLVRNAIFLTEESESEIDFSLGNKVLRKLAEHILKKGLPEGVDLLNVNVSEKSEEKIKITKLAKRMYTTRVQERFDPRGRRYFWIDGDAIYDTEECTDVHAVRIENCISITPLKLDFTSHEAVKEVKKLEKLLKQSLPL